MTTPQQTVKATDNLVLNNGSTIVPLKAGQANVIKAKAGEHYRISSRKEGKDQLLDNVIVKRAGDDLQLQYADGTQLTLSNYYNEAKGDAGCDLSLPGQDGKDYTVSAKNSSGTDLGDGTTLVYAHGDHDALMNMAPGDNALHNTLAGISGNELSYTPSPTIIERLAGINPWWAAAGVAAIGGGAGAAIGMGGGSSHATTTTTTTIIPQNNIVAGSVVAGPVLTSTDTISLYQGDGITLIKTGVVNLDGTFSIDVGSYTGVVIAKLNTVGAGLTYMDETSGHSTTLTAQLMAVGVASTGTLTMNVNALTTVAANKAGAVFDAHTSSSVTTTSATHSNTEVASAFGLIDLIGSIIVASIDADGNLNLQANQYGQILAALSGVDSLGSQQATIDALTSTGAISNGVLNTAEMIKLINGIQIVTSHSTGNDASLMTDISNLLTQVTASISINEVGIGNVLTISQQTSTISGAVVSGATVSLHIGSYDRTATVLGTTWTYTLTPNDISALTQGGDVITATAILNGVTSTAKRCIIVDTTAPTATLHLSADTGTSNTDFITNTAVQTITGTLNEVTEVGEVIEISLNNGVTWTKATNTFGSNSFSYAGTLTGTNTLQVRVSDNEGNVTIALTQDYALDTLAPTVSALTESDKILTITAEAGSTLTILDGGNDVTSNFTIREVTAGNFTAVAKTNAYNGTESQSLSVKATDAAGNVGVAYGTPVTGHIDTTPPVDPTSTLSDVAITGGYVTSADQTITGTAEAGATVTLYDTDGTTVLGTTTADASTGVFSIAVTGLGEGAHTLIATATDAAGNTSTLPTNGLSFTVDTVVPDTTAPVDPTSTLSDVAITGGYVTSADQTITGTAEAGATVTLYDTDGTTVLGTTTADASTGVFSIAVTGLGEGAHTLIATATDAAGNTSTLPTLPTNGLSFTVDTIAPTIAFNAVTLQNLNDANINPTTTYQTVGMTITGTNEAGSTVIISNGVFTNSVSTIDATHWSYLLSSDDVIALANDTETLTATAIDSAGNTSTSTLVPISAQTSSFSISCSVGPLSVGNVDIQSAYVPVMDFTNKAVVNNSGTATAGDITIGTVNMSITSLAATTNKLFVSNAAIVHGTGNATVGNIVVGAIQMFNSNFSYSNQAAIRNTAVVTSIGSHGNALVGNITLDTVSMSVGNKENQLFTTNRAYAKGSQSGNATVGNTAVGNISLVNNLSSGSNYVSLSQRADSYNGNAVVGNINLVNIAINQTLSSTSGNNWIYVHNYAQAAGAATVGTITVNDIVANNSNNGSNWIAITNAATGGNNQSADVSGLVTVGNVNMHNSGNASQGLWVGNFAVYGNASGVNVGVTVTSNGSVEAGTVSMVNSDGSGYARFTVNNSGLSAGDVNIGNVTMAQQYERFHVSNVANFHSGTVGTTTVGDILLTGGNSIASYWTDLNYIHAEGGTVAAMTVGNVNLSAGAGQYLTLGLDSHGRQADAGVSVLNININLSNSTAASAAATAKFDIKTNGDIQVGNIKIRSFGTGIQNATVNLSAQEGGLIQIGDINVSGGLSSTDNFSNLTRLLSLHADADDSGTITVGNVDYSGYLKASIIDVSNWLGAEVIRGSKGGSIITDNNTVNTIYLDGLGNNTVKLATDANNVSEGSGTVTASAYDIISGAFTGDTIASISTSLNNSLGLVSLSGTTSYAEFLIAAGTQVGTVAGYSALTASDGTNTFIAMENAAHTGVGQIVELAGYTGAVSLVGDNLVLGTGVITPAPQFDAVTINQLELKVTAETGMIITGTCEAGSTVVLSGLSDYDPVNFHIIDATHWGYLLSAADVAGLLLATTEPTNLAAISLTATATNTASQSSSSAVLSPVQSFYSSTASVTQNSSNTLSVGNVNLISGINDYMNFTSKDVVNSYGDASVGNISIGTINMSLTALATTSNSFSVYHTASLPNSAGNATVGNISVGSITLSNTGYKINHLVIYDKAYANTGSATIGNTSIGAINMSSTNSYVNQVHITNDVTGYSFEQSIGNTSIGSITIVNTGGVSSRSNTDSMYVKNNVAAYGTGGVATIGNLTVGDISLLVADYGANKVTLSNWAKATTSSASVGTIMVGNIVAEGHGYDANMINITNKAQGARNQISDSSGLITVGTVSMSASSSGYQQLKISNQAINGTAAGITVGDVSMTGNAAASFYFLNKGLNAGNVTIGDVIMTSSGNNIGLCVSNIANSVQDTNPGHVGTTTIGDIALSGNDRGIGNQTALNCIVASGSQVGLMSIGNVNLSVAQGQDLHLKLLSWGTSSDAGITVQNINVNLGVNQATNTENANLQVFSNGNINVGDISISISSAYSSRNVSSQNATVYFSAQNLKNISIGNVTVTAGLSTTNNLDVLTHLVSLNTDGGSITVGNIDYSAYQGASTLDVSGWLGANQISGSLGGSTITDNNTANTITLHGTNNDTVNLVSDSVNNIATSTHVTINGAMEGDLINSYFYDSVNANTYTVNIFDNTNDLMSSNETTYSAFLIDASNNVGSGSTNNYSALTATDGTNTYIAMENAAHTGVGQIVELAGYTAGLHIDLNNHNIVLG